MKKTNFTKKEKTKHFTLLNSFWISTQMHQLVCKQCTEFYFWVAHSTNQLEPALVSIALIRRIFEHLNHSIEFPYWATQVSQQIKFVFLVFFGQTKLSEDFALL